MWRSKGQGNLARDYARKRSREKRARRVPPDVRCVAVLVLVYGPLELGRIRVSSAHILCLPWVVFFSFQCTADCMLEGSHALGHAPALAADPTSRRRSRPAAELKYPRTKHHRMFHQTSTCTRARLKLQPTCRKVPRQARLPGRGKADLQCAARVNVGGGDRACRCSCWLYRAFESPIALRSAGRATLAINTRFCLGALAVLEGKCTSLA